MERPSGPARTSSLRFLDHRAFPEIVLGANDGIVATAGIVEGFAATSPSERTLILAAIASLAAGALSLGGAMYAEYAAQRDSLRSTIEDERRRLSRSPDVEFAELEALYLARGLSAGTARQVAQELTAHDALNAHIEAEYGILPEERSLNPLTVAVACGVAFAGGSMVPLLAAMFAPAAWRLPVIFAAAIVALCITSGVLARAGRASPFRTLARALIIGISTMLIGLGVGRLVG